MSDKIILFGKDCRFSIISNNKIQLEYLVPITYNNITIKNMKIKIRYSKIGDSWSLIYPKERFFNMLSISNSIKRKFIKPRFGSFDNKDISICRFRVVSNDVTYDMINFISSIEFNDISWYRNYILNSLLY
jgi:hypothetical protein